MPLPFLYPKKIHRRTQRPPVRNTVAFYGPHLRTEFDGRCVYCCFPDTVGPPGTFEIDHYKPESRDQTLRATYSNLYYACRKCNRTKGDYWPTPEERAAGCVIVNPCDHRMAGHLQYAGAQVEPSSAEGHWTVALLFLNDEEWALVRETIIGVIESANQDLWDLKKDLDLLRSEIDKESPGSARYHQLDAALASTIAQIDVVRVRRLRLGAGY